MLSNHFYVFFARSLWMSNVMTFLVRFPNPLASGHSWQLRNLTTRLLASCPASRTNLYLCKYPLIKTELHPEINRRKTHKSAQRQKMCRYTGKLRATGKFGKLYGNLQFLGRTKMGWWRLANLNCKSKTKKSFSGKHYAEVFKEVGFIQIFHWYTIFQLYLQKHNLFFQIQFGTRWKYEAEISEDTVCANWKKKLQIQFRARQSCWAASLKVSPKTGSSFSPPSVFFYRDQHDVHID